MSLCTCRLLRHGQHMCLRHCDLDRWILLLERIDALHLGRVRDGDRLHVRVRLTRGGRHELAVCVRVWGEKDFKISKE